MAGESGEYAREKESTAKRRANEGVRRRIEKRKKETELANTCKKGRYCRRMF